MHHQEIGDNGHIAPRARNLRLAKRNQVFFLGDDGKRLHSSSFFSGSFAAVEKFMFKEDDRVIVSDRGLQQPFTVVWIRRAGHLQARNVHVEGFQRLPMLRTPSSCADRRAHHHWHTQFAA